jgi:hypothetical protein
MPAVLSLIVVAGFAIGGAAAIPNTRESSCTVAQKSQRLAALAAFEKQMDTQRKAYFAHHRSANLRRAFVHRQQAHLKQLQADAACTVSEPPTNAARLSGLQRYAAAMTALMPLFDPNLTAPADDALQTITSDIENCDTAPEDFDCPVPLSEYQATAKALRDAAGELNKLSTKLTAVVAPTMNVSEYSDAAKAAASDCGLDLTTITVAHRKFLNSIDKWATRLGDWADTYAAGKAVDWDTVDDYVPGSSTVWDEPNQLLLPWGVMVTSYWNSLAEHVTSAPEIPTWISDLNDAECPPPDQGG